MLLMGDGALALSWGSSEHWESEETQWCKWPYQPQPRRPLHNQGNTPGHQHGPGSQPSIYSPSWSSPAPARVTICAPLLTHTPCSLYVRLQLLYPALLPNLSISAQLLLVLLVSTKHELLGSLSCSTFMRGEQSRRKYSGSPCAPCDLTLATLHRLFPWFPPDYLHALRARRSSSFFQSNMQ